MLPLNKNPDYNNIETYKAQSKYYDFDPAFTKKELWDVNALDTAIENFLMTEPGERLFNLEFGTPIILAIFENVDLARELIISAMDKLESYVPIKVNKSNMNIQEDPANHSITIMIPYDSNDGMIRNHIFGRRIRK